MEEIRFKGVRTEISMSIRSISRMVTGVNRVSRMADEMAIS